MPRKFPFDAECYNIYFDIVDFTQCPKEKWPEMIDILRQEVRFQLIKNHLPRCNNPEEMNYRYYINHTGDGAVIVLNVEEGDPSPVNVHKYVEAVCTLVQQRNYSLLKEHIGTDLPKNGGKLRASVHFGENQWGLSRADGELIVSGAGINKGRRAVDAATRNNIIYTVEFMSKLKEDGFNMEVHWETDYYEVKVKKEILKIVNVYAREPGKKKDESPYVVVGNRSPPRGVSLEDPAMEGSIIPQLRTFKDDVLAVLTKWGVDHGESKFRISILACIKLGDDTELLIPHSKRINELGGVVDQPSKLSFVSGKGVPGIAWMTREPLAFTGLPEAKRDDGAAFVKYCNMLKSVGLTKSDVKKFRIKDPSLPRAFISLPLIHPEKPEAAIEEARVWGIVSIDFIHDLMYKGKTLVKNEGLTADILLALSDQLRYISSSLASLAPLATFTTTPPGGEA